MQHPVSLAKNSPADRQAERDEIARLTKEWERKNGKVKTTPIMVRSDQPTFNNQPPAVSKAQVKPDKKRVRDATMKKILAFMEKNPDLTRMQVCERAVAHETTVIRAAKLSGYVFLKLPTKKEAIAAMGGGEYTVEQIAEKTKSSAGHVRSMLNELGLIWKTN